MKKNLFHPRNRHRDRYDFAKLTAESPSLALFVRPNPNGDSTIDFADPEAVKALNRAILLTDYGIVAWDIPADYLCPAIPGRADYIHSVADLLAEAQAGKIPVGNGVRVLDIGTGANLAYPLIGRSEYEWSFVGTDIDRTALESAEKILRANPMLAKEVELRHQASPAKVFADVVKAGEYFEVALCNPPFHASLEEAAAGTQRKWRNLGKAADPKGATKLNFGGRESELVSEGGERGFILRMIRESSRFGEQIGWFTTLVSKETNLPAVEQALIREMAAERRLIEHTQGQKKSRIIAWRFGRREATQAPRKN